LKTPLNIEQLKNSGTVDLAIESEISNTLNKQHATQWLGLLRNNYTNHIILIESCACC